MALAEESERFNPHSQCISQPDFSKLPFWRFPQEAGEARNACRIRDSQVGGSTSYQGSVTQPHLGERSPKNLFAVLRYDQRGRRIRSWSLLTSCTLIFRVFCHSLKENTAEHTAENMIRRWRAQSEGRAQVKGSKRMDTNLRYPAEVCGFQPKVSDSSREGNPSPPPKRKQYNLHNQFAPFSAWEVNVSAQSEGGWFPDLCHRFENSFKGVRTGNTEEQQRSPILREPGDSQHESIGRKTPIVITFDRFAQIASNMPFAICFSPPKRDSQKRGSAREPLDDSRESSDARESANRFVRIGPSKRAQNLLRGQPSSVNSQGTGESLAQYECTMILVLPPYEYFWTDFFGTVSSLQSANESTKICALHRFYDLFWLGVGWEGRSPSSSTTSRSSQFALHAELMNRAKLPMEKASMPTPVWWWALPTAK